MNFTLFVIFSRKAAAKYLVWYTLLSMGVTLLLLLSSVSFVIEGNVQLATLGVWASSELFDIYWNFSIDALTYVMLLVVLTVSTLVHLYSTEYMSEDPHLARFLSYLSLFTFFMLLLITADNFVGLFLGWEGVGLCSYLLISFWFTRIQANKAAIKAMIVNRIADLAFTIGVLAIFYTFQTVEFSAVFGLAPYLTNSSVLFGNVAVPPLTLITTLLFLGAMGKSAQIGLHTWLPDAMEGPTPVSALIHAATMVTAGVFLIIRCSYLFECVPSALLFITCIGASTAFMAATVGLLQNDLKKVIAYSTCSQLGYMVFVCGLSEYALSLFHLANHAFFKALLFLSAGAVIHSVSNEQDLRRLGGLLRLLPYTYVMFLIGSLALMGFPFLTGFYSKDIILEVAAGTLTLSGTFAHWLGLITAFFTAFYSFRLLYLAFYGNARSPQIYLAQAHELTGRMALSLAILSLGSIFLGYFARDLFIGFGTDFWNGTIYTAPALAGAQLTGEFLPAYIKMLPFMGSIVSVALVFLFNEVLSKEYSRLYTNPTVRGIYRFLSRKWYFDTIYNRLINVPLLFVAYNHVFKSLDKGLFEVIGPTGAGKILSRAGYFVIRFQTGRVYDYAWFMFLIMFLYFLAPVAKT
jgi:proton-translocating NADH-quinone oxidoreductase chain L